MKTHFSEQRVAVHPRENIAQNSSNSFRSRRSFISSAACAAGAIGLSPWVGSGETEAEAAAAFGRTGAVEAFEIRRNAALAEFNAPAALHANNGDEQRYSNNMGNYSKGLPHNSVGEVELAPYNGYLNAIRSGQPSDFENITLGGITRLTNPQAGVAFGLEGADSGNLSEPPSPAVASQERADEAVENYWMALLRDVPFTDYPTDPMVSHACSELSNLSAFTGPRINGQVTTQTLFRGFTAGGVILPRYSPFLLRQGFFVALPLRQPEAPPLPRMGYNTQFSSLL